MTLFSLLLEHNILSYDPRWITILGSGNSSEHTSVAPVTPVAPLIILAHKSTLFGSSTSGVIDISLCIHDKATVPTPSFQKLNIELLSEFITLHVIAGNKSVLSLFWQFCTNWTSVNGLSPLNKGQVTCHTPHIGLL